jgi:Na+-transporting methylmalonyl-CoA/oxaloacetate decarboxylase gamma subunit
LSDFGQGLTLSGAGILITFAALGILIVLILVLKTVFPGRVDRQDPAQAGLAGTDKKAELRKRAAAAGVVALLGAGTQKQKGDLGKVLETPPGEWWRKGLDRIHGKE